MKPASLTAADDIVVERAERVREEVHGMAEQAIEHLARPGRLHPQLARGQHRQVDVVGGVVPDVHPGLVELADLIGG